MSSKRHILSNIDAIISELQFLTSRSSKPGGQNVNKLNTRVTLSFNIHQSQFLTDSEKAVLISKWKNKLNEAGRLILHSQLHRSQLQNKKDVLLKFEKMLENAFKPVKKRIATKPKHSAQLKRLESKRRLSDKKKWRRKPE